MRGEANPLARSQIGRINSKRPPGDQREHPGAVSDVDQLEHGQDRADQEHRVADHAEHGYLQRHEPRRPPGRGQDEPSCAGDDVDRKHGSVPLCAAR